jgi:hypothetical protein
MALAGIHHKGGRKGVKESRTMKKRIISAALCLAPLAASAEPDTSSNNCMELVARVMNETGAELVSANPSIGLMSFRVPSLNGGLWLSCGSGPIYVNWAPGSKEPPTDAWFSVFASAGAAVTDESPKKLEATLWLCYGKAQTTAEHSAERRLPRATVICGIHESGSTWADIERRDSPKQ